MKPKEETAGPETPQAAVQSQALHEVQVQLDVVKQELQRALAKPKQDVVPGG